MTEEERAMRVPHACTLGCQIAPTDHFPKFQNQWERVVSTCEECGRIYAVDSTNAFAWFHFCGKTCEEKYRVSGLFQCPTCGSTVKAVRKLVWIPGSGESDLAPVSLWDPCGDAWHGEVK
jgi:hypothetical protein